MGQDAHGQAELTPRYQPAEPPNLERPHPVEGYASGRLSSSPTGRRFGFGPIASRLAA